MVGIFNDRKTRAQTYLLNETLFNYKNVLRVDFFEGHSFL